MSILKRVAMRLLPGAGARYFAAYYVFIACCLVCDVASSLADRSVQITQTGYQNHGNRGIQI